MFHHFGEQATAAVRRLHRDHGHCRSGYRPAGNGQRTGVRPAGRHPPAVNLEAEAAVRFEHLPMRLPAVRHILIVKAVQDRREEFFCTFGCHVYQLTLSKVRWRRIPHDWAGHQAGLAAESSDSPCKRASTGVPSSTVRVTVQSRSCDLRIAISNTSAAARPPSLSGNSTSKSTSISVRWLPCSSLVLWAEQLTLKRLGSDRLTVMASTSI